MASPANVDPSEAGDDDASWTKPVVLPAATGQSSDPAEDGTSSAKPAAPTEPVVAPAAKVDSSDEDGEDEDDSEDGEDDEGELDE